ncbi:hypothetical protein [uncultured Kordia sp.]|uniref:hypothetical protein n=1 Tax=uncultured Kordia sp. TaxID=507699 RepID=UPI0026037AD1|nr:hypothetical protein [uncultured Kordia sp.]
MKKQKVSLKKLQLSKSKVSQLNTNDIVGGGTNFCVTVFACYDTFDCVLPTFDCDSFTCITVACQSTACPTFVC